MFLVLEVSFLYEFSEAFLYVASLNREAKLGLCHFLLFLMSDSENRFQRLTFSVCTLVAKFSEIGDLVFSVVKSNTPEKWGWKNGLAIKSMCYF